MQKGIIYVMSTAIKGLVKIGKTENFKGRMDNLEKNGYSNVTGLKREFAIEVEEYDEKEKLLHNIFSKSRVSDSEFFALDIDLVIQLLSSFEGVQIYPKDKDKEEIFKEIIDNNTKKIKKIDKTHYTEEEVTLKLEEKFFYLKRIKKDIFGTILIQNGKFVVKKGSKCSLKYNENLKRICKNRKLKDNILQEDIICDSPSAAGSIITGNSINGWIEWKDEEGNSLDYYRKKGYI